MQATPGTPLSADDSHPRATPRRRITLALSVAVVALILDLVTKTLAVERLQGHAPVHVVGDLLRLNFTRNPGAAFSTGENLTPVISVLALVAAGVAVFFTTRTRAVGWAWALGLVLAGIVGNLVDRIFREPSPLHGHVVDFLQLPHWPIFNVADICINAGAVLIVIQALRGVRLDGGRND